jgi:hypothetical protein
MANEKYFKVWKVVKVGSSEKISTTTNVGRF